MAGDAWPTARRSASSSSRPGSRRMAFTESGYATALDMARTACLRRLDEPLIHYGAAALTGRDVAAQSDALASALSARGVTAGNRVAIYLQNVPEWPVAAIAAWKLGSIVVPVNPMLRERELALILGDSGAKALIADEALPRGDVSVVLTVPSDFAAALAQHAGERPSLVHVDPEDVACLVYTSGTTGPPKGAMVLHRNLTFTSTVWRDWPGLREGDVNLVLAPL